MAVQVTKLEPRLNREPDFGEQETNGFVPEGSVAVVENTAVADGAPSAA